MWRQIAASFTSIAAATLLAGEAWAGAVSLVGADATNVEANIPSNVWFPDNSWQRADGSQNGQLTGELLGGAWVGVQSQRSITVGAAQDDVDAGRLARSSVYFEAAGAGQVDPMKVSTWILHSETRNPDDQYSLASKADGKVFFRFKADAVSTVHFVYEWTAAGSFDRPWTDPDVGPSGGYRFEGRAGFDPWEGGDPDLPTFQIFYNSGTVNRSGRRAGTFDIGDGDTDIQFAFALNTVTTGVAGAAGLSSVDIILRLAFWDQPFDAIPQRPTTGTVPEPAMAGLMAAALLALAMTRRRPLGG